MQHTDVSSVYPPVPEHHAPQPAPIPAQPGHEPPRPGAAKKLRYYQIGIGVIGLFTLILTIFVLVQASAARQDTQTYKDADRAAGKLDNYITANQKIPVSLAEAGAHNISPTVSYKKLSNTQYRFCATYKSAANSYGSAASVTDVVARGIEGSSASSGDYSSSTSDYLYISPVHKKGQNCQTIKPYIDPSYAAPGQDSLQTITDPKQAAIASGAQATVCYISGYNTHYAGTVSSVATADGGPLVPTTNQDIILKVKPYGSTPSGEQTVTLGSSDFNIFDNQCSSLYRSSFAVGDAVSVFLDNDSQYMPGAVVNFSHK